DVGEAPFQCGSCERGWPDGYTPDDGVPCVCRRTSTLPDAAPAFQCNADLDEPNDTFDKATDTSVGPNAARNFANVAVCPADDRDLYKLTIDRVGTIMKVDVTFIDLARKPPKVDLLEQGGGSVHPDVSSPRDGEIVATFAAAHTGFYYAQVTGDQEVNYSIRVSITLPQ